MAVALGTQSQALDCAATNFHFSPNLPWGIQRCGSGVVGRCPKRTQNLIRLIDDRLNSSHLDQRHHDVLVRLREMLESDLSSESMPPHHGPQAGSEAA